MMKMLLKLILNILLRPQMDSDLALENLALREQLASENVIRNGLKFETVIRWRRRGFKI
jgi:hypothetical protein